MDITRDNFAESLPVVEEAIKEASFICVDGEFTGISNGLFNVTIYDSPEERYHKVHSNIKNFLLLQFGMCTFCWKEETQQYEAKAFNFYIFPFRSSLAGLPDRIFSCQSSSLGFLIQQGFDFNLAFKKGIPYLLPDEETNIRAILEEKQAHRDATYKSPNRNSGNNQRKSSSFQSPAAKTNLMPVNDQKTIDFLENTIAIVQKFLNDEKEDELILDSCNSYLRKVLYETLPTKFPDQILVESRADEETRQRHVVVVRGADEAVKKERQEQAKKREETDLNNAIGFSSVIKMISESQKCVVGHNMLLDVMFTIQQFVSPLPNNLADFKSLTRCVFPNLLDTKLVGSMIPFKDILQSTALGEMNSRLKESPFTPPSIVVPGKYNVEEQDDNLHEAAYDAFITGTAFLTMVNFLSSIHDSTKLITSFSTLCNIVEPYLNKIFLMKSYDIPYLNIAGTDLSPSRDHVFFVEFPSTWKSNDLRQLFSPFGQITVAWISDTKCLVGLYSKHQAKHVKTLMKSEGSARYRILSYSEYKTDIFPVSVDQTPHKNRVWHSKATPNQPTNTNVQLRKRPMNASSDTPSSAHDHEPEEKRQKSETDVTDDIDANESVAHVTPENNTESLKSKPNTSASLFEVPDQW